MPLQDTEKILIRNVIVRWGAANYKPYPWRGVENPWLALLAEIFLQRTNVRHVNKYFDSICHAFPTPKAVLDKELAQIEQVTRKFGMRRRLKTIVALAEFIDSQDIYPTSSEQLQGIHGIGHYTASAYLSLHMNRRAIIVDANVARWLSRLIGREKPVDVRRCRWVWDLAEALTPTQGFKEYNYAVLDFTMAICRPRAPRCADCPCSSFCEYTSTT
jgi:A/G-specific adenine glycosylase